MQRTLDYLHKVVGAHSRVMMHGSVALRMAQIRSATGYVADVPPSKLQQSESRMVVGVD